MTVFQLILVQVISFVLIVIALRKILYSQSSLEVKRLQAQADESNKKIEALRRKIQEAEAEYQRNVTQAKEDARNLLEEAKKEGEVLKAKLLKEAAEETEKMVKFAKSKKESLEKEMKKEIIHKSINLSRNIIRQVLSVGSLEVTHEAMVDEISQQIDGLDFGRVDKKNVKEAEVTTIFPLKKDKKAMLKKALSDKLNTNIDIRERIDESVVAGIIIKLGNLILDGSLANKLQVVSEQMEKEKAA